MPSYTLRGIEVQFPHEAYDCQLVRPACYSFPAMQHASPD